jgi:hypothetical protein
MPTVSGRFRIHWAVAFILFCGGIGLWIFKTSRVSPPPSPLSLQKPIESRAASQEVSEENAAPDEVTLPSLEEYQKEGSENPHRTPPSLLKFSQELAPMMEKAHQSEEYAKTLFTKLETCAGTPGLPQARAICTVNAGQLVRDWGDRPHSDFEARFNKIAQSLPDDVKMLVQALE